MRYVKTSIGKIPGNIHEDRLEFLEHLMIPISENPEPGLTQEGIPPPVVGHCFRVLTAIELHHQMCFEADKIHDIGADRMLTAKPAAFQLSSSEMPPE